MQDNYFTFLDYRASQRRLLAKFSRPRALLLHTLVFVTAMTATYQFGNAWRLWNHRDNFILPMLIGGVWGFALAVHALHHYRRSTAIIDRREEAVETEMRQIIERNDDNLDHNILFSMHQQFESELAQQARWSVSLMSFAMVNAVSWAVSIVDLGTNWAFFMTLPLAIFIIGGVYAFMTWQQRREGERVAWFDRVPLRHIVAYGAGSLMLLLAGAYRLANHWDINNIITVWGVALLLHIAWSAVLLPSIQWVMSRFTQQSQPQKRKLSDRLVLAEDGEMLDIVEAEWEPPTSQTLRQGS